MQLSAIVPSQLICSLCLARTVTVIAPGLMYSMLDSKFYDVSSAFGWQRDSLAFSVSAVTSGTCSFPVDYLEADNSFLMCAVHAGMQVESVHASHGVMVELSPMKTHRGRFHVTGTALDFPAAVTAGTITVVPFQDAQARVSSVFQAQDYEFFKAYAALAKARLLPLSSYSLYGLEHTDREADHFQFELPFDLQVPLSKLPKGAGMWPTAGDLLPATASPALAQARADRMRALSRKLTTTAHALADKPSFGSRRSRRLADSGSGFTSRCNAVSYFNGADCVPCTVCAPGTVEDLPCFQQSDRTCKGALSWWLVFSVF